MWREIKRLWPMRRALFLAVLFVVLFATAYGCQKAPERSEDPADIERNRQQHIQTMQREAGRLPDSASSSSAER